MDHDYTVVGRVVVGMDVLLVLEQEEPPVNPDIVQTVRLLADLPPAERPKQYLVPKLKVAPGHVNLSRDDQVRADRDRAHPAILMATFFAGNTV